MDMRMMRSAEAARGTLRSRVTPRCVEGWWDFEVVITGRVNVATGVHSVNGYGSIVVFRPLWSILNFGRTSFSLS